MGREAAARPFKAVPTPTTPTGLPSPERAGRTISAMVRLLLVTTGHNQNDLAEALHLAKSGISERMNFGIWTIPDLVRLAVFFDVPVETFFADAHEVVRRGLARS